MTDIEKLKALALAAEKDGQHIYTHPRDSNKWKDNAAWQEAASPEAFSELIADNERLKIENANLQHAFTAATAPDSHVIPPPRGTGRQLDTRDLAPADDKIEDMARKHFSVFTPVPCKRKGHQEPLITARWANVFGFAAEFFRAIEAELARRGRAQGGNTSDNSIKSGAAGTDKDAERYRKLFEIDDFCRDPLWPVVDWMRGTAAVTKEEVDAALDLIGAHTGKPDTAAETMDHAQLQALGQHDRKD